MSHAKVLFFIGKGGVGKTTCSVATAVNLAEMGYRVLLVSLDPAHNAGDAFNIKLSEQKTTILPTLDAIESDLEHQTSLYLHRTADTLKHRYRYLTVLNLDKLMDVIRYSPGIEEYATLEVLHTILAAEAASYDVIIFDTAPTGQTLRVLALPTVSILWTQKLADIRKKILNLRFAVEKIHGPQVLQVEGIEEPLSTDAKTDEVMRELRQYRDEITHIRSVLTNPAITSVIAVLHAEDLPLLETQRAADTLKKFNIPLQLLILNKIFRLEHTPPELVSRLKKQQTIIEQVQAHFSDQTILEVPWQSEEPRGLANLRTFCPASAEFFHQQLRTG